MTGSDDGYAKRSYRIACPNCSADLGDFTFESPEQAYRFVPKSVRCGNCHRIVGKEIEECPA